MADILMMWDGGVSTVLSFGDFLELVDEYMGMEARRYLEEYTGGPDSVPALLEEAERERDGWRERHREVMEDIRGRSEKLAELISGREPDRRAISGVCGAIGLITARELNTT